VHSLEDLLEKAKTADKVGFEEMDWLQIFIPKMHLMIFNRALETSIEKS